MDTLLARVRALKFERLRLAEDISEDSAQLVKLEHDQEALTKLKAVVEQLKATILDKAQLAVTQTITVGLREILTNPYNFALKYDASKKRNQFCINVSKGDLVLTDILESCGGGIVDCVGFLMRIVLLGLMVGRVRRFMVLDEPLRNLSSEYIDQAARVLKQYSKQFGIQVLLITHSEAFTNCADKVVLLDHANPSIRRQV